MIIKEAQTKYGIAAGVRENGNTVFKGIPYAASPVGELRFRAPAKPVPWEGVRLFDKWAEKDSPALNIWTSAETTDDKLPVIFWIHGRGGSGNEKHIDGTAFNRHGCILVSVDFRSGVFASFGLEEFAKSDPHHSTGNLDIQDILAALTWVHENIRSFGGDPDNVTVFGQSSGAMTCRLLLVMPAAWGLFKRIIALSGGGVWDVDPLFTMEEKCSLCRQALDIAGWTMEDLMNRPESEVAEALTRAEKQLSFSQKSMVKTIFFPNIDGYFIKDYYGKIIYNGGAADADIITGTISEEWRNFPCQLDDGIDGYEREFALASGIAWARRNNELMKKPVYHYFYEHTYPTGRPMHHADEMPYMFGTLDRFDLPWTEYDRMISDTMVDYMTSFAKYGDPNTAGRPEWSPYTQAVPLSMYISDKDMKMAELGSDEKADSVIRFLLEHPGILSGSFLKEIKVSEKR